MGEPFTGAADSPNADFTNVFLYLPSTPGQTWDQHVASLGAPTSEQIDAMTGALVCSSYFDALTQYALNPPIFSGAGATVTSCVQAALKDAGSDKGRDRLCHDAHLCRAASNQMTGTPPPRSIFL